MPEIPSVPEFSVGGIVSWALVVLCGAILALWRLNEVKNASAITTLSSSKIETETKYEQRLSKAEAANAECEEDRAKIRTEFAVLGERLRNVEKQMVHKAD